MDSDDPIAALHASLITDQMWRLTSGFIYKIIPNSKVGLIPYEPRVEHIEIFKALIERKVEQLMLLKARRPGFSTAIGIYMLDFAIFTPGVQCSLVDQNAADATRKLEKIICVALDNLPEWITHNEDGSKKLKIGAECGQGGKRSGEQLSLSYDGNLRSEIYAGMNARGGTNHFLHISEWGVIQAEDAARSSRIRSGALPSARGGSWVCETTWAGGKSGDVWELIEPVLNGESNDIELQFCPWWQDPRNTDDTAQMSPVALKYFAKMDPILAKKGIKLTDGQKRFWSAEKRRQGIFMFRENPSILSECWESPAPGTIYGESIEAAQADDRITSLPVSERFLVHTAWDLGAPRQTRVIYFQVVGEWIHIIDADPITDETIVRRVARMRSKGYNYGSHYMPHDAQQTERSGKTLATEFAAAWLKVDPELIGFYDALTGKMNPSKDYASCGIRFVPRTQDVWMGINHTIQLFPELKFRIPACEEFLNRLKMYRVPVVKEGNPEKSEPVHDASSHDADCLRTMSDAKMAGLITSGSPVQIDDKWTRMFGKGKTPSGLQVLRGPTSTLWRG